MFQSFQLKVFALSFCVLVVAVTAIFPTAASDSDSLEETSIPESRTFKTKHVKHLPLLKKHKKVGGWLSHLFSKTPHTTIPTHYEVPPTSIYKVHRYQGIELKPISTTDFRDVSFQTSGPVEESHSYEPPSNDFETFSSADHHLPVSTPSTIGSAFSSKDKPVFTSQIPYSSDYDFEPISVPEPAQPIFAYAPQFVPIAKPFFTSVYSSAPLPTPPPLPPALTFVPHSSPNPTVLPSFPIKTPDVQLTSPHQQITAWSPALSFKLPVVHLSLPPVVAPVPIPKTVPPQLSSIHHTVVVPSNSAPHSHLLNIPDKFVAPALTTEAPVLPSTVLPPAHSPLPLPVSTPSPTPFPSHSLLPNFMPTPPSPHAFGSYLNHDFPYPPSNVPISSHLKDSR